MSQDFLKLNIAELDGNLGIRQNLLESINNHISLIKKQVEVDINHCSTLLKSVKRSEEEANQYQEKFERSVKELFPDCADLERNVPFDETEIRSKLQLLQKGFNEKKNSFQNFLWLVSCIQRKRNKNRSADIKVELVRIKAELDAIDAVVLPHEVR